MPRALTGLLCVALLIPSSAQANPCLDAGIDYVKRREFDKAAQYLECARKGDPENVVILSQLAIARAQQRQYVSAGAAFQLGIVAAIEKGDSAQAEDMGRNRAAVGAQLFNRAMRALKNTKTLNGGRPDSMTYKGLLVGRWGGSKAITDTTYFSLDIGNSSTEQAAYLLELSSYVDPTNVLVFQDLTSVLLELGHYEDAIRAAEFELKLYPGDARLTRNLKTAREKLKEAPKPRDKR